MEGDQYSSHPDTLVAASINDQAAPAEPLAQVMLEIKADREILLAPLFGYEHRFQGAQVFGFAQLHLPGETIFLTGQIRAHVIYGAPGQAQLRGGGANGDIPCAGD